MQRRIELYWRRESEVLYPPIADAWFSSPLPHSRSDDDPLVIVSTLARYKRIDLAIAACNQLKLPLVIIGDGADKARLQSLAGPTVTFVGPKTHDQIRTIAPALLELLRLRKGRAPSTGGGTDWLLVTRKTLDAQRSPFLFDGCRPPA